MVVDQSLRVLGRWWLPGKEDAAQPEVLTFDQEAGGRLKLIGSLHGYADEFDIGSPFKSVRTPRSRQAASDYPLIYGSGGSRDYTLLDGLSTELENALTAAPQPFPPHNPGRRPEARRVGRGVLPPAVRGGDHPTPGSSPKLCACIVRTHRGKRRELSILRRSRCTRAGWHTTGPATKAPFTELVVDVANWRSVVVSRRNEIVHADGTTPADSGSFQLCLGLSLCWLFVMCPFREAAAPAAVLDGLAESWKLGDVVSEPAQLLG